MRDLPKQLSNKLTVTGLILATLLVSACGGEPLETSDTTQNRPVKLITIAGDLSANQARFPAVIDAGQRAELSFQVPGVIQEVMVAESQDISKDTPMIRLDPRNFETALTAARAHFESAEDEYQRTLRLADQNAVAQNVLQQMKTQRDVAQAQLTDAEKALSDSTLVAPFDGIVATVAARSNEAISPGLIVATVINVDSLEATINVPAKIVARVPAGGEATARVEFDVAPELDVLARFSEANLVADATSQTYSATFTFEAPTGLNILPGMNATLLLEIPENLNSAPATVPLSAVLSDSDGQYVWLLNTDSMSVTRQSIEISPGIGEFLTVTAGLSAGDQIVGAGGAYLTEGQVITPWED